jgi:hypothetical protein
VLTAVRHVDGMSTHQPAPLLSRSVFRRVFWFGILAVTIAVVGLASARNHQLHGQVALSCQDAQTGYGARSGTYEGYDGADGRLGVRASDDNQLHSLTLCGLQTLPEQGSCGVQNTLGAVTRMIAGKLVQVGLVEAPRTPSPVATRVLLSDGSDLAERLLRAGWALRDPASRPVSDRLTTRYDQAARQAREQHRGLYAECSV